jgi:hypothetical protein
MEAISPATRGNPMSLLAEIQASLLDENAKIGPILLKLRFLAGRLGVPILEDWVRHETEGYPDGAEIPDYRKAHVTFTGTFQNMVQVMHGVPISGTLIAQHAGEHWNTISLKESISVIDDQIARTKDRNGTFAINSGNLMILLQGRSARIRVSSELTELEHIIFRDYSSSGTSQSP